MGAHTALLDPVLALASPAPGLFASECPRRDPDLWHVTELRPELPYDPAFGQYEQILADFSVAIAPKLGWKLPASIGDEGSASRKPRFTSLASTILELLRATRV